MRLTAPATRSDCLFRSPDDPRIGASFRSGRELHVWIARVDGKEASESLLDLLSLEEQRQAHRFYSAGNRDAYIIAHGTLRKVLAAYTGLPPSEIEYGYSKTGKPYLANAPHGREIGFNMSHDDRIVCYAVAVDQDVGIDVERIKPSFDWRPIVQAYFTREEAEWIERYPADARNRKFFELWTRVEALLKADGAGLSAIDSRKHNVLRPIAGHRALTTIYPDDEYVCSYCAGPSIESTKVFRLYS